MLKSIIKENLNQPGAKIILLGENHFKISGDKALAQNSDLFEKTAKNIIVYYELLPRLIGDKEAAYSKSNLPVGLNPQIKKNLSALIDANVTIYGLETEETCPLMNYDHPEIKDDTDNEAKNYELLQRLREIQPTYPEITDEFLEIIQDNITTVPNNMLYLKSVQLISATPQRIAKGNDSYTAQILNNMKNTTDCLHIALLGCGHIPEARLSTSEVIDIGMAKRLEDELGEEHCAAYYLTTDPKHELFTPKEPGFIFSSVKCALVREQSTLQFFDRKVIDESPTQSMDSAAKPR